MTRAANERASDTMAIESPPSRDPADRRKASYENVLRRNAITRLARQDESLLQLCTFFHASRFSGRPALRHFELQEFGLGVCALAPAAFAYRPTSARPASTICFMRRCA